MERATRYGLCVPVTTIGTAPILTKTQRATHPPIYLQAYHNRISPSHRLDRGRTGKVEVEERSILAVLVPSLHLLERARRIDRLNRIYLSDPSDDSTADTTG